MSVATTAVATFITIDSTTKNFASGKQPLCSTSSLEWGGIIPLGTLSSNVSITLPTIPVTADGYIGDIAITAYQPTGGSYTVTISVGNSSTETITDGSSSGTSIVLTPTALNNMEISCLPVSATRISVLSNETEA